MALSNGLEPLLATPMKWLLLIVIEDGVGGLLPKAITIEAISPIDVLLTGFMNVKPSILTGVSGFFM